MFYHCLLEKRAQVSMKLLHFKRNFEFLWSAMGEKDEQKKEEQDIAKKTLLLWLFQCPSFKVLSMPKCFTLGCCFLTFGGAMIDQ
jgi:hypothetical protein